MNDSPPGFFVHGIIQERIHCSGLQFPPPRNLPDPEIEPLSPVTSALEGGFFTTEPHVSSVTWPCLTLCYPMGCSTSGFPVLHQLLELAQIHVHRVSDATQPSHPLLSPSPPAFNLSQHQGLFLWYSGLISFRMDWFDLLVVQGTLQSLLQHKVQKHQFFSVQFSL